MRIKLLVLLKIFNNKKKKNHIIKDCYNNKLETRSLKTKKRNNNRFTNKKIKLAHNEDQKPPLAAKLQDSRYGKNLLSHFFQVSFVSVVNCSM